MNREDAEEYTQSLGQIVAGSWRQIAWADRQGIPAALGLSTEQWVRDRLGGYVKMSIQEKREAVRELSENGHSVREIQAITGISKSTVSEIGQLDKTPEADPPPPPEPTKAERRAEREAELAAKAPKLPTHPYRLIYADPPWRFEPYSRETGMDRAADNHYPTMELADIKALDIPAASDAVLFLWATVPMLPHALELMEAWKFEYRSHFVWIKTKISTGYWTRNAHELLLIGVRGNVPAPAPGEQYSSFVTAAPGEHSAKPFCFREMIEEMFPNLPRIELFAREKFEGWDRWGNEAPS